MTTKEAKRLLRWTVVMRNGDPNELGTVSHVGESVFYVNWANGPGGWIDYRDAKRIEIR